MNRRGFLATLAGIAATLAIPVKKAKVMAFKGWCYVTVRNRNAVLDAESIDSSRVQAFRRGTYPGLILSRD